MAQDSGIAKHLSLMKNLRTKDELVAPSGQDTFEISENKKIQA